MEFDVRETSWVERLKTLETVDRDDPEIGRCRYPLRNRIRADNLHGLTCYIEDKESLTVKEALSQEDKDNWKEAIKKEIDSMYENDAMVA